MGGGEMPELRDDRRDLKRLEHLLFTAYAMAFPGQEFPGSVESLAELVAWIQVSREALSSIGVVVRNGVAR